MKRYFKLNSSKLVLLTLSILLIRPNTPLWAEPVSSGLKTVLVIGTAVSADASKARDLAVSNGLVSAVSQAADELLPENGLAKYFQEISQTVLAETVPYIQEYQVPAEATAGNVYRVVLKATISMDTLKKHLQDAGFIRSGKELPNLLLLLSEQLSEDTMPRFWWDRQGMEFDSGDAEKAMKESLERESYQVINHEDIALQGDFGGKSLLSDTEALQIGRSSVAEVIVIGDAKVETASNIMGTDKRTFNGVVNIRVLRSDSGELLAEIRKEAVVLDSDPVKGSRDALIQAGVLAGKALSTELTAKWQTASVSTEELTLRVEGISDLSSFVKFRKALKAIPGVNSVFVNEMQADEASLLVDYDGSSDALAEALMLNTYDAFSLNIFEVTADQLKIKIVKASSAAGHL